MALLTEEKQFYNLPSILGTYVVIPPKDVPNNSESIHLNVFIWLKNIVTLAFTMILFYVLRGRIFYTKPDTVLRVWLIKILID